VRYVVCLLVLLAPSLARAGTVDYVKPGSELRYTTEIAPLPATLLAAQVLGVADKATGAVTSPVSLLGVSSTSAAKHWRLGLGSTARRGKAPFAADRGKTRCKCATSLGDTRKQRIAVLRATRGFSVGSELGKVKVLALKLRFRDGVVAFINGREVARRNLTNGTSGVGLARRSHGPEWETFYIPVAKGLLRRGRNVLAVEVRPGKYQLSPRLDVALQATTGPRIVRGPMVQKVGETSAVIVFDTNVPTQGVVQYGPTARLGLVAKSAGGGLALHHTVTLTGLAKQKPVHYRLVAGGDVSSSYRFHTAPSAADPIRFVVYGDVRGGHKVHRKIVRAVLKEAPDFVVVTGDLVLRGSDEGDWQKFFSVAGKLLANIPYYPIAGNHDTGRTGDEQRRMNEVFALWPGPKDRPAWGHWYSFDVANVHFVMLDSNSYRSAKQLRWLEKDLKAAKARGARAVFAAAHDGPYSRGLHRGNRYAAKQYAPLLARYGVKILFSGHDHMYQRGKVKGLHYIVSGGGGAPLYSVSCGIRGKRRCRRNDGKRKVKKAFHYITIQVFAKHVRVCPKRPDGSRLEKCLTYRL